MKNLIYSVWVIKIQKNYIYTYYTYNIVSNKEISNANKSSIDTLYDFLEERGHKEVRNSSKYSVKIARITKSFTLNF